VSFAIFIAKKFVAYMVLPKLVLRWSWVGVPSLYPYSNLISTPLK